MAVLTPTTLTIPKLVKGNNAHITWSSVSGADSYILQRKVSASGSYSTVYSGTNTYYDDSIQVRYSVMGYRVCAVSGSEQSVWHTSDDITVVNAPIAPTTITVSDNIKTGDTIKVAWNDSTETVIDGYILQRAVNGGTYEDVYEDKATEFEDTALSGWTKVQYRVATVSDGYHSSTWTVSASRTITTPTVEPPSAPSSITVSDNIKVGDTVSVTWGASTTSGVTYVLQRAFNGGAFSQVYNGTARTYSETALSNWAKVQYRVAAEKSGSSSAWATSAERTVTSVTPTVPDAPSSITVPSLTSGDSAVISWSAVSGAAGYNLQRSVDGGSFTSLYRGETTSYTDTPLGTWTTAQYRVCAYDSSGNNSDYTNSSVMNVSHPSTDLLSAIRSHAEQNVRITFTDGTVLDKTDIAVSDKGIVITDVLNGDTDYTFGKAVCKQVEMTLFNGGGKFNNFDFAQEFKLEIGVKVGNAFDYIAVGVFKGERPEKIRGKLINFTAYDRMQKFDVSAADFIERLTFPITLGGILTALCAKVGVESSLTSFTNSTKSFTVNPFAYSDYTAREVLAWIAEAAGSYARINENGKVEFAEFSVKNHKILVTDRFEMAESEFETPEISKLECYTSYSDQLVTSGTGNNTYVISDNPFLYIENDTEIQSLQPYVNSIYAKASIFPAYNPISVRAEWYPSIKCGDIITIEDDYGKTMTLPIFSQTITWKAYGKVEYESTGGLTRETQPVEQRELEEIKKRMLRTADLSTAVESYLNTQEGKASITSAVEGKFVEVSDGSTLTTSNQIQQLIETTEKGINTKISLTAGVGKGTIGSNVQAMLTLFANADSSSISLSANALDLTATETTGGSTQEDIGTESDYPNTGDVPVAGENEYSFTKTSDGYWTSQNAGIHNSFSYGTFTFTVAQATTITVRCISYGEADHDFGVVSSLDTALEQSNTEDSTGVFKSFKGLSSASYTDLTMTIPRGTHYFTFKYIKDSNTSRDGDYFKIKCFVQKVSRGKATLSLKSGNVSISSADINFNGLVTFTDLSTRGATTIEGGNVTTDNLYVENVFFKENDDYTIVTSEMSGENGIVKVGVQEPISGMAAFLELYGSFIYFVDPSSSASRYKLSVQTHNQAIIPGGDGWDLGGVQNYFNRLYVDRVYFSDNTYINSAN